MNHVIAATGSRRYTTRQQDLQIKEQRAWRVDTIALHLARGRAAIDVALGEILLRLGGKDRLDELGYSNRKDYANEELGLPHRTFFALEELALGLRSRPLMKQAVLAGEVSPVKARIAFKAGVSANLTAVAEGERRKIGSDTVSGKATTPRSGSCSRGSRATT